MEVKRQNHEFPPVYDENSEILILGSFPSVKSREMQFFYGHPQNRFWKVLAQVLNETVPQTIPEKKEMLLRHHIALWDVIASCDIAGSSDSSIRNVVPNDLAYIIGRSRITRIYANGAKSKQLYDKYLAKQLGIEAVQLPSTSPANAAYSVERLLEYWQKIIKTPEKERQSMLA
ncbi:DNA-deoxyinosine glycosylase [uncultured Eubacterium sp.]|nr:DNA-deoxyinosine glycosylase [uncultured Eubacterium sp.]